MSIVEQYISKKKELPQILELVQSHDEIEVGHNLSEPLSFLNNLHQLPENISDVILVKSMDMDPYPFMMQTPSEKLRTESVFLGAQGRASRSAQKNNVDYIPVSLSDIPSMHRRRHAESDRRRVFVCAVSPMDDFGFFRISMSLCMENEGIECADLVIFEVNKNIPRVEGENQYHISQIDYFYEVDTPLSVYPPVIPTEKERTVGEYVASLVDDGACLQLGVGGIPNAAANALRSKKDLGIHTELITPTMCELFQEGVVTCTRKNIDRNKIVAALVMGTQELYDFVADNPMISMRSSHYVNNPFVIAQNDNVVSINGALQVDLTGQVCSESIGSRMYSGTGGCFDFAYGARLSKGGKGIIALLSTAKKGTISTIQPVLDPGAIVSVTRNVADYVVTEYGIAPLRDRTVRQRVENLIAICHPDFRGELRKEASRLMLS